MGPQVKAFSLKKREYIKNEKFFRQSFWYLNQINFLSLIYIWGPYSDPLNIYLLIGNFIRYSLFFYYLLMLYQRTDDKQN